MIRFAESEDFNHLHIYDKHICGQELINSINLKRVILLFNENKLIGWLRYNLFWDNIPFINMLYVIENYRKIGYGKKLVSFWEKEMSKGLHSIVLVSTLSNESSQNFYRKIGYRDCGSLILPQQPLEIILFKYL